MIKTTEMGPNSCIINLVSEPNYTAFMDTAISWLLQHGWEVFDNWQSLKKVLRAPNADGTTYKYVLFDVSTGDCKITPVESWNPVTHTGTNLASVTPATVRLNATVYLFASPRYIVLCTKYNHVIYPAAMVFEHARDNLIPKVVDYPPVFGSRTEELSVSCTVGMPRSSLGVGDAANTYAAMVSSVKSINQTTDGSNYRYCRTKYSDQVGSLPAFATPDFYAVMTMSRFEHRGRVFGLKFGPVDFGSFGDRISIKCDSNGFTDENGTLVDHFILIGYSYSDQRFAIPL